jgi:hypothetical protein
MIRIPFRKPSLLALLASAALSASALTVGIVPAVGEACSSRLMGRDSLMGYLVSGSMNVLYNAGYIVTDESVSVGARSSWGLADDGLSAAREKLEDFFIAIYVEWAPSDFNKEAYLPESVDYRLVRTRDGKVVAEGSVSGPIDSETAPSREAMLASQAGAFVAEACASKISTLAMGGE